MSTLQEVVDEVAREATAISSLVAFVQGLQDQIAHAVPSLTSEQQGQINMVFAAVHANKDAIAAAMAMNVPAVHAAPDVTEVPAVVEEVPMP